MVSSQLVIELIHLIYNNSGSRMEFNWFLQGIPVIAKEGKIQWHYSSLASSDTITNTGFEPFGKTTGNIWRGNYVWNDGVYYIQVGLSREISKGFSHQHIWVRLIDCIFQIEKKVFEDKVNKYVNENDKLLNQDKVNDIKKLLN